jgi:hypothetical protein
VLVSAKKVRVNQCLCQSASDLFYTSAFPALSAVKNLLKTCSKPVHFLQKDAKTRQFLTKKCRFLLIFTLILRLKTNMSYKITYFTIASHPNFQNFSQNPLFS